MSWFRSIIVFVVASACFGQTKAIKSNAPAIPKSEMLQLLTQICPGGERDLACSVCPEGSSSAGASATWTVEAVFYGHFLSASSQDALVNASGCESHADGMSSSVLLTRQQSSWRIVRYMPGTRAGDCRLLQAADGRDRLVCAQMDGHYGFYQTTLSLFDPGRDPASLTPQDQAFGSVFLSLFDSTNAGACQTYGEAGAKVDSTLQMATLDRVEFTPLPSKDQVRIVASAREGSMKIPAKLRAQICAETAPEPDLTGLVKQTRYEFIFDGKEVKPARR